MERLISEFNEINHLGHFGGEFGRPRTSENAASFSIGGVVRGASRRPQPLGAMAARGPSSSQRLPGSRSAHAAAGHRAPFALK